MRHHAPGTPPAPSYYVPAAGGVWGAMTFVVRTTPEVADVATLVPRLRTAVADLDESLPLFDVQPLTSLVARQIAPQRLASGVLTSFGALALILAAIGIYGVMAFTARQRAREAAIRLALGDTRWGVARPLLRDGGRLVATGLVSGLFAAWWLTRATQSRLAYVDAPDPWTLTTAAAVLGIAALVACVVPAWRVSNVNPIQALRGD
jgi:putative ABC transport system permease protein